MNFNNAKLLILGDVMLDQYWFGATHRISPEAPVPVVHINRVNERPGGAANVALAVKALGAAPYLLGLVGLDDNAKQLEQLLISAEVQYYFETMQDASTITKLRVLSRNQQMIRLDKEKPFIVCPELTKKLENKYLEWIDDMDAVILSDYGKGTLSHSAWFIQEARKRNIPVIVDPKSLDFSQYRKASIIKPNLKEFEAVVGPCASDEILINQAHRLIVEQDLEALVITRSERGISVVTKEGTSHHVPAQAREVHDVTGAGDTVIAVLACALACKIELFQAATLGNIAGGIAVGKLGANTVSLEEIQAMIHEAKPLKQGVVTEQELLACIRSAKSKGEKIVFTNGCFDILHAGHVLYLEQAKCLGDRVIVAVNSDDSVKRLKGETRPVNTLENRMSVLAGLKSVDWVVSFGEDTPERIIQAISPHVLVKGGDYKNVEELPGAHYVLNQGGKVELLGVKQDCSTTKIIEAITAKNESLEKFV